MTPLSQLPNLGPLLADRLTRADIQTAEELRAMGTEQAFIRLRSVYKEACINMLYAIEGAVQGIRWHNLPQERKDDLKAFLRMLKSSDNQT